MKKLLIALAIIGIGGTVFVTTEAVAGNFSHSSFQNAAGSGDCWLRIGEDCVIP